MRRGPLYVKIKLDGEIVEDPSSFSFFSSRRQLDFRRLLEIIRRARDHKRVTHLLLVIKRPSLGWSQIEEMQGALDAFQAAGKEAWAFLEKGANEIYYLASSCRRIFMPPVSNLELVGLRVEIAFFRRLLSMLGVEPQLFNVGLYKSAAEIFTREEMSCASREAVDSLLDDIQGRLRARMAKGRGVTEEQAQRWIDGGPYTSTSALEAGLLDELVYEDELEERLDKEHRAHPVPPLKLIHRGGWIGGLLRRLRPRIAYIAVEGMILEGRSKRGLGRRPTVGCDTIRELLSHARRSRKVKAVLLRVNSPGGSALASDLIWREVIRTAADKPVVMSVGDVAASGGYYIAAAGKQIFASPSSMTGSIGVLGGKFSLEELLQKVQITVDSVQKGQRAGYNTPSRPFQAEEAALVREQLEDVYRAFLERVAEGRNQTVEQVRKSAEGRVWTGQQALERNLVDQCGGIFDAVEAARSHAGLAADVQVELVPFTPRRRLRDYLSLPMMEASSSRAWTIMPFEFRIR